MEPRSQASRFSLLRAFSLAASLLVPVVSAWAAPPQAEATVTVAASPTPSTSVSRDGVNFYVAYTVTITNPSNSSKTFDFAAVTEAVNGGSASATYVAPATGPAGLACNPDGAASKIVCLSIDLDRKSKRTFTVTFQTPSAGDSLKFNWTLYFPKQPTAVSSGTVTTQLITLPAQDAAVGFKTFVPASGGTFFTGVDGGGGPANPGGVAIAGDPWTTTIVVPPIPAATTLEVFETASSTPVSPVSFCVGNYANYPGANSCFSTSIDLPNVSIPAPGPYLTIILRIDVTKITGLSSLSAAKLYYQKTTGGLYDEVKECAYYPLLPVPGEPCLAAKFIYPGTYPIVDFRYDWQFEIRAASNGRYIN